MAGIVRSPLDEIKAIQALLADVYKDAGDGRTLFRELVQNADDAGARWLGLTVLERGWSNARNSLLHGPALLVANDGAFPHTDRKALHKAIGGSKENDVEKIGTFGIGLKSVFHICETFLYIGADESDESNWHADVVNPWFGTGESQEADPLHPDWDVVEEADAEQLRSAATQLLGKTSNGFLLWIPLRCREHLDRGAEGLQYGLGEHCPKPDDLCAWFGHSAPAALLLAQCGHLRTIETARATGAESLRDRATLVSVTRQRAGWLGRYRDDNPGFPSRDFEGLIESDNRNWSVVGIETLGSEGLRKLRSQSNWPQYPQWESGRHSTKPRQALAHAAVTVLRPNNPSTQPVGTRLRWAVFLPLDDDPEPRSSMIVESEGSSPAWEIILHGYFWPSQDRRSIPGVTDNDGPPSEGDMRTRWNRALCEELLLPLLPSALANASVGVDEKAARELLDAVVHSDLLKHRLVFVRRRQWLLPTVAARGVRWTALDARVRPVLSIPDWSRAPERVRKEFIASCEENTDDAVFIDDDAPRLADELNHWTDACLERLLNCIAADVFVSADSLRWIRGIVRHVLGPNACGGDTRAGLVARWLARQIGDGALAHTTRRSMPRDSRDELRGAWGHLCEALPQAWLVETPVRSQQAVAELAAEGMIGEGLLPMPFGTSRIEWSPGQRPDHERLNRALSALGHWLEAGGESERLRHSRLLLAEALLSRRDDRPLGGLDGLPLLRTTRLPDDREEAWSAVELRRQTENDRVFANPVSEVSAEGDDHTQLERHSDPKRAATELAEALNEAVWLVSGDAAASLTEAPSPTPEALAEAVLRAEAFADPEHRRPVVERLAPDVVDNAKVRLAVRSLLTGRAADVVGPDAELFHNRDANGRALGILLRLLDRPWRAIQPQLVQSLSRDIADTLGVGPADWASLHRLLDDCLRAPVDWTVLSDMEATHLLRRLYGAEPEAQRRWRMMPLHRDVDGGRAPFDHRARRSTGNARELRLPQELEPEVRLLDPDPDVAHLYDSVPEMDRDGILQLMLEDECPWRFAEQIVCSVRQSDGPVFLPQDGELRNLLRSSCWLPRRNGDGLAPDQVLIVPNELDDSVRDLSAAGAFGENRLPGAIAVPSWNTAEPVVRAILGHLSRERQVQRLARFLDAEKLGQVEHGAWLVMPRPDLVDASLIDDALQTTLAGSHPGWKVVHAAARALRHGVEQSRDSSDSLLTLGKALCGPIHLEGQINILTSLASVKPAKDSPGGRLFRITLKCFAEADGFVEDVLRELDLPTQDGNWHASRDVARSQTGVARRHRLIPEIRPILQLGGDDPVPNASRAPSDPIGNGLNALERYFEPWRGRVPHGAVGSFLSLLGNGLRNVIRNLADEWLGEDVAIKPPEGYDRDAVSVWVRPQIAHGNRLIATNVLGSSVEMEAEADETLFAIDPVRRPPSQLSALVPLGAFWEIALRDVEPQNRAPSDLLGLLGSTVERWATTYLELPRERVNDWWSRWGIGAQADFGPVLASIKAHLPLTLQQFDVNENAPLRDALRKAERAQRRREQSPSDENLKVERGALDDLEILLEDPQHRTFVWRRVNALMRRYGYEQDSVLLELAQNADDALAEAAEINGGSLSCTIRRLVVRVHEDEGTPTVDIVHWGRPINDTGGAAFPAGRERQWDQDLYFMMLMNLSGKPGEMPGVSSLSSTTGRFGLGFKSVHLVSSSPSVLSGFIAFSIAGGLLPQERPVPDETNSWMIDGRRLTRVRLPLRPDVDSQIMIERLFRRFAYARALLPAFARQVREVVVEGGPFPGVHVFDGDPINGAASWSVGAEVDLANHVGSWRILRFRPADTEQKDMGTAALAVGLRNGVPTAFGPDVPFIWNVTPTSESWGCGYVVNGPFKLDPGRTHVSLDDDTTVRAVDQLGSVLGKALIELHDVLASTTARTNSLGIGNEGRGFLSSLWTILACGLDNPDGFRRGFLRRLHGKGRGLTAWTTARSVVPTGLPAPFHALLPPLRAGTTWEVAIDGLDDPDLCEALAEINDEDFTQLVDRLHVVSAETERLLRPLSHLAGTAKVAHSPSLRPCDLVAKLAEQWDYCLTPARLHALRPVSQGTPWHLISNDPQGATWRGKLRARSADGSFQPLRGLLLRGNPSLGKDADGDLKDEFLRSAFAPDDRALDTEYIERSEDCHVFRWLRVQHRVDAAEIADWYLDLDAKLRPAAFHYLLHGELQERVLSNLVPPNALPKWLQHYDDVREMLEGLCEEPWRRQRLLGALFPDRFRGADASLTVDQLDSETFFQRLLEWWDDGAVRTDVVTTYEKRVWPAWLRRDGISSSLQAGSVDHWLALLVLGMCRSLGRAQDHQHRSFLELAHREGWWDVFKTPDNAHAWMEILRRWQDGALDKLTYPRWMSLFPAIYQFSRYLGVYVRLLKSVGHRPKGMYDVSRLLAPRVDQALTGAGTHFDAPPAPLNMGLHWVLRELVRFEVVEGEHVPMVFKDCWVPSEQVLRFLEPFGLEWPDDHMSNSEKAHAIFDFLASELGTATPNLHRTFDIPIRHIASNAVLRGRFGLEQS